MIPEQVPKIKPCLHGIPFDSEKDVNQLPTTPILSILQFTLCPGVNLSEPSQPASTLWRASLEFISTIPGFQGLHWEPVNQTSPSQQVLVLIQWDSGLAWRRFQCSIGFTMLLGYITETYNRCAQLSLPAKISSSSQCILELVSYQFSPKVAKRNQNLKTKWDSTFLPLISDDAPETELLSASGDWLQIDHNAENRYFSGLLFWKADMQAESPQRLIESNLHNIANNIEELSRDTVVVVSAVTRQLQFKSPKFLRPKDPVRLSTSTQSNYRHPVMKTPIIREYNLSELIGPGDKDQVHLASIAEKKSHQRIGIGPAGGWNPMGLINQHYMPQEPHFSPKSSIEMIPSVQKTQIPLC